MDKDSRETGRKEGRTGGQSRGGMARVVPGVVVTIP